MILVTFVQVMAWCLPAPSHYLNQCWFIMNYVLWKQLHEKCSNVTCWYVFRNDKLNHWGRVTHICVGKLTIIGSDNGLLPGGRQAIIWTNAGILLIGPLGTNFNENLIEIHTFSFKKIHLKMSSGKWRPFCLGLNVLNITASSPRIEILIGFHILPYIVT